ncbi:MAG TPA: UDP-N-acetylmuramoyl-L-alanine--D-glutamate ligase [Spirochaetia bacterium]|nr:UDP-N-acetylmuramoyl-L-alanine--D-glutamate ligase [Spirochaetia bacterium]HRZ66137.1 UDP-N-acetylmuramoyl-L-alanine--D-glutamate ligase [Spirochaetia bacterium]
MGLGLNGGGLACARFLAERGALVTVTDTKDEAALAQSMAALEGLGIRYVLGRHEMADFEGADLVVKNPAVRPDSPYLKAAKAVETDLSLFLRLSSSPLIAVTGSKGKSTVSTAIYRGLLGGGRRAFLGGNIAVSPLGFLDQTGPETPVVLELSSWQLADMRGMGVLRPKVALLTSIMPDHMNRYSSMEEYVADKRLIYADQGGDCFTLCNRDEDWGRSFAAETGGSVLWYSDRDEGLAGAWLEGTAPKPRGFYRPAPGAPAEEILGSELLVPGAHQRKNLLAAALALRAFGVEAAAIREALSSFPGVEHRLEFFAEAGGVRWYNDSAATIPQAVGAALRSFEEPVVLVTGGTDKNIDFEKARAEYRRASALVLLAGSGTEKLRPLLDADALAYSGPYAELGAAVEEAARLAKPGSVVLLSPGCTSFGMFLHEFDRGARFKETVRAMLERGAPASRA